MKGPRAKERRVITFSTPIPTSAELCWHFGGQKTDQLFHSILISSRRLFTFLSKSVNVKCNYVPREREKEKEAGKLRAKEVDIT